MKKYFLQCDGHRPTDAEIAAGKRQYRRENPKDRWSNVLMIFSDVNGKRSWSFSEFVPEYMNAKKV